MSHFKGPCSLDKHRATNWVTSVLPGSIHAKLIIAKFQCLRVHLGEIVGLRQEAEAPLSAPKPENRPRHSISFPASWNFCCSANSLGVRSIFFYFILEIALFHCFLWGFFKYALIPHICQLCYVSTEIKTPCCQLGNLLARYSNFSDS